MKDWTYPKHYVDSAIKQAYRAETSSISQRLFSPGNTSRRCSRCGMINAPKGAKYECRGCGLRIDRQLNAAINLYLQMEGAFSGQEALQRADEGLERSP
ncbi:MAG: zinc ribbon domain-containing protein [Candidatus Hadarchaeales archaeon]